MKIPGKPQRPYRLGVALSGGGARGFAHIGALRALNDLGLYPDVIAGVSAGAVVAVSYAAGLISGERNALLDLFQGASFTDFARPHLRLNGDGLMSLDRFEQRLTQLLLPYRQLEELPVRTFIGATDLDAGIKAVFSTGPIAERVVASCSIPIVFEPKEIDGTRYVDGGVLRNLPAWTIRHLCDTLIGINCSPPGHHAPAHGLLNVAQRAYTLMAKTNVTADNELCDTLINLEASADHQVFDLHGLDLMIETAYLTTLRTLRQTP